MSSKTIEIDNVLKVVVKDKTFTFFEDNAYPRGSEQSPFVPDNFNTFGINVWKAIFKNLPELNKFVTRVPTEADKGTMLEMDLGNKRVLRAYYKKVEIVQTGVNDSIHPSVVYSIDEDIATMNEHSWNTFFKKRWEINDALFNITRPPKPTLSDKYKPKEKLSLSDFIKF
jgi:hypothetical protein